MEKLPPKRKFKAIDSISSEELKNLDKKELVERIRQLEAHNTQLRNIISKANVTDKSPRFERKNAFDFSKVHYRRVLLRVMYFGWQYQGLAVQEGTAQTIEHHLFNALTRSCLIESRDKSGYHRAGRTDKGVSAFGQVISITLRSKYPKDEQNVKGNIENEIPYCGILNKILPEDIKAICWMPIPADKPDYSARFDCKKRQYKYYFPKANLNIAAMSEACKQLIGHHDFRNLCKMDVGNGVTEFYRHVFRAEIVECGCSDEATSMCYLVIEGNAFLWHQIRCIFGVLLLVGEGKEKPCIITQLLDVSAHPRKPQYAMALDVPLNLYECSYELEGDNEWVYCPSELRSLIVHLQALWTMQSIKTTMIKDCLESLENVYSKLATTVKETEDIPNHVLEEHIASLGAIKEMEDITTNAIEEDRQLTGGIETGDTPNHVLEEREASLGIKEIEEGTPTGLIEGDRQLTGVKEIEDRTNNVLEEYKQPIGVQGIEDTKVNAIEEDRVISHANCLLQGVKSRIYKPLLERDTCSSLEERITYYKKRRKVTEKEVTTISTE